MKQFYVVSYEEMIGCYNFDVLVTAGQVLIGNGYKWSEIPVFVTLFLSIL